MPKFHFVLPFFTSLAVFSQQDMFGVCLRLRSHDFYGGKRLQKEAMTLPTWALDYPPLEAEGLVIQLGIALILLLFKFGHGNNMGEHTHV